MCCRTLNKKPCIHVKLLTNGGDAKKTFLQKSVLAKNKVNICIYE